MVTEPVNPQLGPEDAPPVESGVWAPTSKGGAIRQSAIRSVQAAEGSEGKDICEGGSISRA